jgi:AraC-like DNA-binding protein
VESRSLLPDIAALGNAFQELTLAASLVERDRWRLLHGAPNVVKFEIAHGASLKRTAHNQRSIRKALASGEPVVAEHAGFLDLFAPLRDSADNVLVVGPFRSARLTALDLRGTWKFLTRSQPREIDSEFARFAGAALATPVFEGKELESFTSFARCFALLLGEAEERESLLAIATAERAKLALVRLPERHWTDVASMLDQRLFLGWTSFYRLEHMKFLGLDGMPEHAVVGLFSISGGGVDSVELLVARDAVQRAAVELARKIGNVLCGKVGDHGLVFVVHDRTRSRASLQARHLEIGERMRSLARRFGFRLHLGISDPNGEGELPLRYQGALQAAERALYARQSYAIAEPHVARATSSLGDLRRELTRSVATDPSAIGLYFDRYLQAVAAHTGIRFEAARAHAEAGFDQVVDALGANEICDAKGIADLREALDRPAEAGTVHDLFLAYGRTMAELERAVLTPRAARHDRGLSRTLAFVRDHLNEPLSLARVAKVAGFAPAYFSRLFASTQGKTFHRFLSELRVERAKRMLESTDLPVERIGRLAGFRSQARFHAVFRKWARVTPAGHRRREIERRRLVKIRRRKRQ